MLGARSWLGTDVLPPDEHVFQEKAWSILPQWNAGVEAVAKCHESQKKSMARNHGKSVACQAEYGILTQLIGDAFCQREKNKLAKSLDRLNAQPPAKPDEDAAAAARRDVEIARSRQADVRFRLCVNAFESRMSGFVVRKDRGTVPMPRDYTSGT
eukprot:TRINITY_DN46572_c0_g1_i1.p1 TRINITY_DN46572_c0_g1~~TRINITY_DN46572_c0_g1_i1.p1  ORF type:complete len:155 (-),score=15.40 TRINITY_DN46572_c0_g1_i1:341-805(-)